MTPTPATEDVIAVEPTVELGGTSTRRLSVSGAGIPFLLIHGFADSADTWRWLLPELAAAGRAAAAIDLAGFGTAEAAPGPRPARAVGRDGRRRRPEA